MASVRIGHGANHAYGYFTQSASTGHKYHQTWMPERSFGRSVRYRRTKLGLSQAQLGELVGRSASSIRSWERDDSTPTDASVLLALSAILDLDQRALFEKAGIDVPAEESHPTVEQALASLAPSPGREPATEQEDEIDVDLTAIESEPTLDADSVLEAEVNEHLEEAARPGLERRRELDPRRSSLLMRPEPRGAAVMKNTTEPAFVSPPEPFTLTEPSPPFVEPSYMEDSEQRQLYRVRNLATIVLVVALVIVLLWSLSNTMEAFGEWWGDFFGSLRF